MRCSNLIGFLSIGGAVVMIGCQPSAETQQQAPSSQRAQRNTAASCLAADSLRRGLSFNDLSKSEETNDVSGVEITLRRSEQGWSGSSRVARGQLGASIALHALRVDSSMTQLSFGVPTGTDTATFQGRLTCDSLVGRWTLYKTVVQDAKVFRRG